MARYLAGEHNPQQALPPRVAYVAEKEGAIVGYIAGHCTRRFGADGELQWIVVSPEHRGGRVASMLLRHLAAWFSARGATRICVNVEPGNAQARRFYAKHGARELSEYWMEWPRIGDILPSESERCRGPVG